MPRVRRVHGRLGRPGWLLLSLAVVATGAGAACSNQASPSERTSTGLTVPVPAVTQFVILAARAVTVGDRGAVTGGHVGVAAATSGAPGALTAGFDARVAVGQVLLAQAVTLRDRAATGEIGANRITVGANVTSGPRSAFVAPPAGPVGRSPSGRPGST